MAKAKIKWERNTVIEKRVYPAHVFRPAVDGVERRSLCGAAVHSSTYVPDDSGRYCASCRKIVDPENAPKAPTWRGKA